MGAKRFLKELLNIKGLKTHISTDRGAVRAVDGVDLVLHERETLAIVGESGCGKTMTALSILRLLPPRGRIVEGSICFDGTNILDLNDAEMRKIRGNRISMIFQEPMTSLNPVFRVGFQIGKVIELHQGLGAKEALRKTVEMLKRVGIPSPETRVQDYPHQMSGGMRQRVMVAMALSCDPRVVIADEPTTALDVTIQAQILNLMNRLKEERAMSLILITHDLGVVAETAQNVAVMYAGRVVEYTDVLALFRNPMHPYTRGLLHSIPMAEQGARRKERLSGIPGQVPSLLQLPSGCRFQDRCPSHLDRCLEEEPELSEPEPGHQVRCWKVAEGQA
jgi:peptide/nickel transport system ATP-binding protein